MSYYLSTNLRHTIIGSLRAVFRLNRFIATFLAMSVLVVVHRVLLPASIHRARGERLRRFVGRRIADAAGVRIRRTGSARSSISPMIVCNHISWLDAFVLGGELGARFVATASWESIPVLATVLRAGGILFIDRAKLRDTQRVSKHVGAFMKHGERILIFTEATTSRGADILPFRGALLEPAAVGRIPVSWAVLRYETPTGWPAASVVVAWTDWTPIVLHMYRAFHVPRIDASILYGPPISGRSRKELAVRLHTEVRTHFTPLEQLPPADLARVECPRTRWK